MKKLIVAFIYFFCCGVLFSQKTFSTKSGQIKFLSNTALEDVEATNNQVFCALNPSTNKIHFSILIKGFAFENALMQKHFNEEEYMHSDKYPKASFSGTIKNIESVNFNKNGNYKVTVVGNLILHGVTKSISTEGSISIIDNKIILNSKFNISPADYKITVPEGISNTIIVTVGGKLE